MKKLINSKKMAQKILIVIILILMLNFIIPNYSQADFGGLLLKPVTDLFGSIGDVVCAALQFFLVDGNFLIGNGGILTAFLTSSDEYDSSSETFPDYPDIDYNSSSGVSEYEFYTDDIDLEGMDLWANLWSSESVAIPVTKYTPEAIFAGQIPALDINFINPKNWRTGNNDYDETNSSDTNNAENQRSVSVQLHETIATWYVALRNLAIVGLMIILVYVGIRMVISSAASDKAKYKQLFLDWIVAMCLLFCLHYIMSFTITITQEITNAINGSVNSVNTIPVTVYKGSEGSTTVLAKFNTSLTGIARFQIKMDDGGTRLLYTIVYLALVIYTVMFTLTYLKRVITMAFLTLIAPLVALTYPIDKMNDGKAQAFNSWLKEYVFNALLQPFHLIIYTVFIGSAMDLASKNPIYAIVALAFITPAEKILRKFFGFGKAETAGTLGTFASMAGGAAAYKMLGNAVNRHGGKGGKGGSGSNIRTKGNNQKALKDPDAPSGVDGFTGHNDGALEGDNADRNNDNRRNNLDKDQKALDALRADVMDDEDRAYLDAEQARIDAERQVEANSQSGITGSSVTDEMHRQAEETAENMVETDAHLRGADEQNRGFGTRLVGGLKGSGKSIASKASTTIGNKHWRRKLYKKAGKGAVHLAARGYATVALGAAGLATGIGGDNLEDVLTYGIGGATLGATVGGNILANTADRIGSGVANSAPVQGFVNGYTGSTSVERQVERQESRLQADSAFIQQVNEQYADGKLEGKELKEATARAARFASYGVNTEKLGKTMKVEDSIMSDLANSQMEEEEKRQLARQQATTAAKMAEKIKNPEALVGKKGEELQARWAAQIKSKNTNLSDNEAKVNAAEMMKRVRKIKGV